MGERIETAEELASYLAGMKGELEGHGSQLQELQGNIGSLTRAVKAGFIDSRKTGRSESLWDDEMAADCGRWLRAVARRDSTTKREIREKAAIGTTPLRGDDATQGGDDLLPEQFVPEILRIADEASALMNRATKIKMFAREAKVPTETTGFSWTWTANETAERGEVAVEFGKITLTTRTAAGWFSLSEEVMEDTPILLGRWLAQTCGETWGLEFDRLMIDGDVDGASDPFDGILYADNVNEHIVGTTTISGLDVPDFRDTVKELTSRAKRTGAVWMMAPVIWDEIAKLTDANGRPMFVSLAGERVPLQLAGYPVVLTEGAPETDTPGAAMIAFGNPRHLIHGDRISMEIQLFAETLDRIKYGMLYFTARIRCALEVGLPAAFARLKLSAS